MKIRLMAALGLGLLMTGAVMTEGGAAEKNEEAPPQNRYLGVLPTYFKPDDNRGPTVDYGNGVGFLLGKQWDDGLGLELSLFSDLIETGENQGTDYYRQNLGLDAFYAFGNRKVFTPFVLIGAGVGRNDVFPDDRDSYDWVANGGLGFVTSSLVFDLFRVRGEFRYFYDNFEDGSLDYRLGLGLEIPIRREVVFVTETVIETQYKTITETKTEEKVKVVEVDTGLTDSDEDGVVDSRDRCPDTPHGTRVDGDGCPLKKVTALRGVTFELNSARLRPDSRTILAEVGEILKKYPDLQVEIAGHTDATGRDFTNQVLSQRRAESVLNFLTEYGVPPAQMTAAGYGETQPVATNETREGREQNRRVEMRVKN
jgi:OOP family OmpA-OmpF porin